MWTQTASIHPILFHTSCTILFPTWVNVNIPSLRVIQQNDDDHLVIIGLKNEPVIFEETELKISAHFCCSVHHLVLTVKQGKVPENINPAGSTARGTHSCWVMAGMWGWLLFISAWPNSPFLRGPKSSDWVEIPKRTGWTDDERSGTHFKTSPSDALRTPLLPVERSGRKSLPLSPDGDS